MMNMNHCIFLWIASVGVIVLDQAVPTTAHRYRGGGGGIAVGDCDNPPCPIIESFQRYGSFDIFCSQGITEAIGLDNFEPFDPDDEDPDEGQIDIADPCKEVALCFFHGVGCETRQDLESTCFSYDFDGCEGKRNKDGTFDEPDLVLANGNTAPGICQQLDNQCQNSCVGSPCTSVCDGSNVDDCPCNDEGDVCENIDYCGTYGRFCQYNCQGQECENTLSPPCDPIPYLEWLLTAPESYFDLFDRFEGPSAESCKNVRNCYKQDGTGTNCNDLDLLRDCAEYVECDCAKSGCDGFPVLPDPEPGTVKEGSIGGDPHIRTWSGNRFDFHGICDVVLVSIVNFDGTGKDLTIQARTRGRFGYSFIEKVAIRIGDEEEETLEVESFGQYALAGVDNADLSEATLGGYLIYHSQPSEKEHVFDVLLGKNEYISISTFKDIVSIKFHIPETGTFVSTANTISFANSTGIMGRFSDGKLLARDGKTEIADHNKFGEEWQVLDTEPMLFRVTRSPQYPQQCEYPSSSSSKKLRGLGQALSKEKAERACSHLTGEAKEACVEDVMLVGDVDIAKVGEY